MATGVTNVGLGGPLAVTPVAAPVLPGTTAGVSVRPVLPVGPVAPIGQGGNPSPPSGELLPAAVHAAASQPQLVQLQAAVDGVNRFLRDSQRQILFQIDMKGGHQTVTIINPATGEVIRQIPSAQVLAAATTLQQAGMPMAGLFVDERI